MWRRNQSTKTEIIKWNTIGNLVHVPKRSLCTMPSWYERSHVWHKESVYQLSLTSSMGYILSGYISQCYFNVRREFFKRRKDHFYTLNFVKVWYNIVSRICVKRNLLSGFLRYGDLGGSKPTWITFHRAWKQLIAIDVDNISHWS